MSNHLMHLEDSIFYGKDVFSILKQLKKKIEDPNEEFDITIKYDGSPSIVFGHDLGKFFIATKSAFNKKMLNLCYSLKDIQSYYAYDPSLVNKLSTAFLHLNKIVPNNGLIYQGDLLFTKNSKHIVPTNEGKDFNIEFTPNLITYAVTNEDMKKDCLIANLGIVVHSVFSNWIGGLESNKLENPKEEIEKIKYQLNSHNIFCPSIEIDFSKPNYQYYPEEFKIINKVMYIEEEFLPLLIQYINYHIRNDLSKRQTLSNVFAFMLFIEELYFKMIEEKKLEKTKKKYEDKMNDIIEYISEYAKAFTEIFEYHKELTNIKLNLLQVLDYNCRDMSCRIGNLSCGHEGYVIHYKGETYKIVNREVFSKLNFEKRG